MSARYRAQARQARRQEAIAWLSWRVLSSPDFETLAEEAVRLSAETLELEYASVLELRPELGALVLRSGSGWGKELRGVAMVSAGPDTHAGAAVLAGQTVVLENLRDDPRYLGSHILHDNNVVSGASAVIAGPDGPYGVLTVHSTRSRSFDAYELTFLEILANTLGGALLRKHSGEQLEHQALHDSLTGLANRVLFDDRLAHALARAVRNMQHTTVALLDLDNFKAVNDSLGHAAGDQLLVVVAERLRAAVRPSDTVARLGGDEFAVLFEQTVELEALGVADRILEVLREPLLIDGRPVVAQASIGIASNRAAEDETALLRNADLAMYAAKAAGKGGSEVYHGGMHEAVLARLELEGDLRAALEHALAGGELRLVYQPQVSLETNLIIGVEALLRWEHPERGTVSPLEFIPLAEETGLIVPIGRWVLEEACRQIAGWRASSPDDAALVMSVNVSARQFEHGLVDAVQQTLAVTGVDPASLCLEVTESSLMVNVKLGVATLHALKDLGVKISIDDFGTGYSSLNYLKQFPLDELKIDKSFVDGLDEGTEDGAIVAAIMGMAHALNLSVVAEGVETRAQVAKLQTLGCEVGQGYYFSRPEPAAEVENLLARQAAGTLFPTDDGPSHMKRLTVLIVDDASEIRETVRMSLRPAGYVTHEATTGEEALVVADSIRPDCVLLDVSMPGMSGFEVCRALRAQPSTSGCAVMMLTSSDNAVDKVEAFSLDADDYIMKPFVPRDLVSRVSAAIQRRNEPK